jgi:uncharacterized membrane protein
MDDELGRRMYREYCWFALILFVLLIGFANRVASSSHARDRSAAVEALPETRDR